MVDVTLEPLSETNAKLTIAFAFEGHGVDRLVAPLIVERQARHEMPLNLATLKEHLEGSRH
jgi:hypothetical protein